MKKKTVVLGLLLCSILCGCGQHYGNGEPNNVTNDTQKEESPVPPQTDSTNQSTDEDQVRLAYYEQLVSELRQEILDMKTELYTSRVEYEARIAELEAMNNNTSGGVGETDSSSKSFRYVVEGEGVTITAYVGSETEVVIPSALDGHRVTAIGDRAFMDQVRITSVVLPDTVQRIGWFAFSGCVSLERAVLPDSVKEISYGVFQNCPSHMQIVCSAGSYAEQYANSYGILIGR